MIKGLDEVIDGIGAPSFVEGAGFGQKGQCFFLFHPPDDGLDEIRADMSVIVALPNMELDGNLLLGLDDLIKMRGFDQLLRRSQPLLGSAVVWKFREKNSGSFDGSSSRGFVQNDTSSSGKVQRLRHRIRS